MPVYGGYGYAPEFRYILYPRPIADHGADALKLHLAIAGAANGGVGAGVSPVTALSVGLKVDLDALPGELVAQLKSGLVDLNNPATTLALLKLNSAVGIMGFFDTAGKITSLASPAHFATQMWTIH